MTLPLSSKALAVEESVTLAISARAGALRAAGKPVISLSAGEPDFGTPDRIRGAGIAAIERGDTLYTPTSGIPRLREQGAAWLRSAYGLAVDADEVMVTAGAKPALHLAFTSLLNPGDKVLVLAPFWVSYPDLIALSGGEAVLVPPVPAQGHLHTAEQIEAAARESGAVGIVLNFPNNPSGAVPDRAWVEQIVATCAKLGLWIVSDEIYGLITYEGAEHVSPATVPGGRDRTIVITGGTKSHSMTGWRVGFFAGPAAVVAAAGRIQSQVLGNPCTISQHACIACVTDDFTEELRERTASFDARRRYLIEALPTIPGVTVGRPRGAFYALADASGLCAARGVDDVTLAQQLLDEAHVATVPGTPFGIPDHIRLSYAASLGDLEEAIGRMRTFAENTP